MWELLSFKNSNREYFDYPLFIVTLYSQRCGKKQFEAHNNITPRILLVIHTIDLSSVFVRVGCNNKIKIWRMESIQVAGVLWASKRKRTCGVASATFTAFEPWRGPNALTWSTWFFRKEASDADYRRHMHNASTCTLVLSTLCNCDANIRIRPEHSLELFSYT